MMTPGSSNGRIQFIQAFDQLVKNWPSDTKWPLTEIAGRTVIPIPLVVDCITELTDKEIDIHDPITYKEADRLLTILKQRMRHEIERYEITMREKRERAKKLYSQTNEKIRILQMSKNWYSAYRTLSYFAGKHGDDLSLQDNLDISSDCLRLGLKGGLNIQELGRWLQKGIQLILKSESPDIFEEAMDFIDAYAEPFLNDANGKGEKFLSSIMTNLNHSALELGMSDKLYNVMSNYDLNLPGNVSEL